MRYGSLGILWWKMTVDDGDEGNDDNDDDGEDDDSSEDDACMHVCMT